MGPVFLHLQILWKTKLRRPRKNTHVLVFLFVVHILIDHRHMCKVTLLNSINGDLLFQWFSETIIFLAKLDTTFFPIIIDWHGSRGTDIPYIYIIQVTLKFLSQKQKLAIKKMLGTKTLEKWMLK